MPLLKKAKTVAKKKAKEILRDAKNLVSNEYKQTRDAVKGAGKRIAATAAQEGRALNESHGTGALKRGAQQTRKYIAEKEPQIKKGIQQGRKYVGSTLDKAAGAAGKAIDKEYGQIKDRMKRVMPPPFAREPGGKSGGGMGGDFSRNYKPAVMPKRPGLARPF